MTLLDYINLYRKSARKPTTDIRERWATRILARNLHLLGRAGGEAYLRDYGRGISAPKLIALAVQAEREGYADVAMPFWDKAYALATGTTIPTSTPPNEVPVTPSTQTRVVELTFPELPAHLQPGAVVTMQPIDADAPAEDYIRDNRYCAQSKRDGNRIVVFASHQVVRYQSRSTSILESPGEILDEALRSAARQYGSFVLDGERVFLDHNGGEHRTGAQAAHANTADGNPGGRVTCQISVFKALFSQGLDLTGNTEDARIHAATPLVNWARASLGTIGGNGLDIEQVPTAWSSSQKHALLRKQEAEGREGIVWVQRATAYIGGKVPSGVMLRTKFLTETECVITGLTSTTADGRPFGAIEVAESKPDGAGKPLGRVGTGFSQEDAQEIAAHVARHPEGIRIVVRHQGTTETGMLWHARFVRIVGPVGMAA